MKLLMLIALPALLALLLPGYIMFGST